MKISTIYSALFAALAIGVSAGPVPVSTGVDIITADTTHEFVPRAGPAKVPAGKTPGKAPGKAPAKAPAVAPVVPVKTERYKQAIASAGKTLAPNTWHVFTIEWDLSEVVSGTTESEKELAQLQHDLKFSHVAVVAGMIKEIKEGRGKNEKITLDFDAYFMDLMKGPDKVASVLRGPKRLEALSPKQKLKHSKQTTAAKGSLANMTKWGKAYFTEAGHQVYSVKTNNCATFRDAVLPKL
jgi:hypothetical protein